MRHRTLMWNWTPLKRKQNYKGHSLYLSIGTTLMWMETRQKRKLHRSWSLFKEENVHPQNKSTVNFLKTGEIRAEPDPVSPVRLLSSRWRLSWWWDPTINHEAPTDLCPKIKTCINNSLELHLKARTKPSQFLPNLLHGQCYLTSRWYPSIH